MTMKAKIIGCIASVIITSGAMAQDKYFGVELGKLSTNATSYSKAYNPTSFKSYSLFMGQSIGENLSAEFGFIFAKKASKNYKYSGGETNTTMSGQGYYADLVKTTDKSNGLYAIGSVGIGKIKIKDQWYTKVPTSGTESISKNGLRMGIGAGYNFNNGINGRLMVRKIRHKTLTVKSIKTVTFGITKAF